MAETTHTVQRGDSMTSIAYEYGFTDYKTIYDHPKNKDLKKERENPNTLFPGDQVFIPKKELKHENISTEKSHAVTIKQQKALLQIALVGLEGKPFTNMNFDLEIGDKILPGMTDDKGIVKVTISPDTHDAFLKLFLDDKDHDKVLTWQLKIGGLQALEKDSGQKARLNNLGYNAGDPDAPSDTPKGKRPDDQQFASAIEEFQCDNELKVDGICGDHTQKKLKKVHGC